MFYLLLSFGLLICIILRGISVQNVYRAFDPRLSDADSVLVWASHTLRRSSFDLSHGSSRTTSGMKLMDGFRRQATQEPRWVKDLRYIVFRLIRDKKSYSLGQELNNIVELIEKREKVTMDIIYNDNGNLNFVIIKTKCI
ncbi:uncharacterized protein LOC128680654 isoform X2 [Plodia interpunctella]|uniref:uncharacterized protein LOC128680654 isoform X2 n=1 Tax=Plodia interpunctella TaxID=58824 RepID=UPI0023676756|nr:uncharacterized protein LOC128680654 isoform X2 [Plodia interpunctella]